MFAEKFGRFIKGYVEFKAEGGFPERFINLCSSGDVDIQNVRCFKNTITASCGIKSYKKLRHIAKKTGMKVRLLKKHGLPFFIHKKRDRFGILIGFVFLVAVTTFLSGRIWVINVDGNENLEEKIILSEFYKLGVKKGIKKDSINVKEIARKALTEVDGLMWNAVNIDGCTVTIEVKEQKEKQIEEKDENTYSNLVASKPGQIIKIENFLGTPVPVKGSGVDKGDVLISGAVINKNESVSFYNAEGNVFALTKNTVTESLPPTKKMRVYKRPKKKYYFSFYSITLPVNLAFGTDESYAYSWGEKVLCSQEKELPFSIKTERYTQFENKNVKLNPTAQKLMCAEKYFCEIDKNLKNAEVKDEFSKVILKDNIVSVESKFECVENIAERKAMNISISEAE